MTIREAFGLEGLLFDLGMALRGLRRDRAFTVAAIAILTFAIGLNVTVFTVMDAMLFRGFPLVKENDRLLYLQERGPSGICCISYPDFEAWRSQAQAFEGMAFVGGSPIALRDGEGRPIDMRATTVSANTFALLGVAPMLGRDFVLADEDRGAPPVAILDHDFWTSRFGQRADIAGLAIEINGTPATIIGVMPERFDFPFQVSVWMPAVQTPALAARGLTNGGFTVVARLRDGAESQEAQAELETINRRLAAAYPETNRDVVPTVATHSEMMSGREARVIWGSLWVGSWFVFAIACANLANLTLVRTLGRTRELSTKLALGAGQRRMIRQMLMESLMLASVAGAFGWWLMTWSVRRWTLATASQYQILDYAVDARTLTYLVAVSLGAAVLCALAPIVRVMHLGLSGVLKGSARGISKGRRGTRLALGLVAGQMALALILLSGAGVLVRSFANIVNAATGVRDPDHVLVGLVRLPSDRYPGPEARREYFDRLSTRLKSISGVLAETMASTIPVRSAGLRSVEIEGRPTPPNGEEAVALLTAGTDYFRILEASIVAGRAFDDGDRAAAAPVAIVNESFAARTWPGEPAVGKRLRTRDRQAAGEWRVVVGVVANIMQGDPLRQQFKPLVYVPFAQEAPGRAAYFLARTSMPPEQVAQAVRGGIQGLDPDVSLENFRTLKASFAFDRDFMDAEHSELGKHAAIAPVFASLALLLAAVGLAAVIAHSVSQRTHEIGVRMAIGAAARDISRMILRQGMLPVAVGLSLGLGGSLAVNRLLQSQLIGVSPDDPATMATAAAVLLLVALGACQLPARRAMRVDPVVALRHE